MSVMRSGTALWSWLLPRRWRRRLELGHLAVDDMYEPTRFLLALANGDLWLFRAVDQGYRLEARLPGHIYSARPWSGLARVGLSVASPGDTWNFETKALGASRGNREAIRQIVVAGHGPGSH